MSSHFTAPIVRNLTTRKLKLPFTRQSNSMHFKYYVTGVTILRSECEISLLRQTVHCT
jgi:hypothetical protein